jgi:biopolymer transport protein TolR
MGSPPLHFEAGAISWSPVSDIESARTPNSELGDKAMAFSTAGSSAGDGPSSEINVTPLIDVLLVMLIIFMVIVPVMPSGLNAALPATPAHAEASTANDGPVMIRVECDEAIVRYFIDGASVVKAELAQRLEQRLARTSTRQMLVKADAGLDYGAVAAVIDAGQAAGASGVGLVTPKVERLTRLKD